MRTFVLVALVLVAGLTLQTASPAAAAARPPAMIETLGWTPEGYVDPAGGEAQRSQIAIDDQGAPIVVWAGRSLVAAQHEIRFSRFDGTSWSLMAPAFAPDEQQNQLPRLSRAADGTLWLAWLRFGDPVSGDPTLFSVLMAARRVNGVWSAPETVAVDLPLPRRDLFPSEFAVLSEGPDNAWVAFAKPTGGDPFAGGRGLYSARRTAAGWGAPVLIGESGLAETRPELARGPGGQPVVFYGFAFSLSVLSAKTWNGSAWEQGPEDQFTAIAFYEHAVQPDTSGAVRLMAFVREDVAGAEVDHVREFVWDADGFHPGPIVLQAAVVEGGSGEPPDWTGLSLATSGPCTKCPVGTPPLYRPLWVDFTAGETPRVFSTLRSAAAFAPIDVAGTALEPGEAYPNATYDAGLDRWYAAWSGPPSIIGQRRAKFAWTQEFAGDVGIGATLLPDETSVQVEVVCSGDATDRSFRLYRLEFPAGNAPFAPPIPAGAVELTGSPFDGPCPLVVDESVTPGRYFYYVELVPEGSFPGAFARSSTAVIVPEEPGGPGGEVDATVFLPPYPQPALGGFVTFPYDLVAAADDVRLLVHDLAGRIVRRFVLGPRAAGEYRAGATVQWNGADENGRRLPGGVYFARLWVDGVAVGDARRVVFAPSWQPGLVFGPD